MRKGTLPAGFRFCTEKIHGNGLHYRITTDTEDRNLNWSDEARSGPVPPHLTEKIPGLSSHLLPFKPPPPSPVIGWRGCSRRPCAPGLGTRAPGLGDFPRRPRPIKSEVVNKLFPKRKNEKRREKKQASKQKHTLSHTQLHFAVCPAPFSPLPTPMPPPLPPTPNQANPLSSFSTLP